MRVEDEISIEVNRASHTQYVPHVGFPDGAASQSEGVNANPMTAIDCIAISAFLSSKQRVLRRLRHRRTLPTGTRQVHEDNDSITVPLLIVNRGKAEPQIVPTATNRATTNHKPAASARHVHRTTSGNPIDETNANASVRTSNIHTNC